MEVMIRKKITDEDGSVWYRAVQVYEEFVYPEIAKLDARNTLDGMRVPVMQELFELPDGRVIRNNFAGYIIHDTANRIISIVSPDMRISGPGTQYGTIYREGLDRHSF